MGDAISHAVLPGVAMSFILGINFFIGAIAFGKTEETFTKENLHAAYGHELFIGGEIR